jgi:SepF-like predicted cell division protein (DUF552 family)
MAVFGKIKDKLGLGNRIEEFEDVYEDEFVEIDPIKDVGNRSKIMVKSFVVQSFDDIKETLNALREGYTIALINIRPLKDKDIVELKRTINKLKKTCDAIEGDIAGISEDWIVVTPAFARVHRSKQVDEVHE